MEARLLRWVIVTVVVLLLAFSCVFTVSENQYAIRSQFGEIVGSDYKPGLHLRWPPLLNSVDKFERRIMTRNYQGETFLTSENKGLNVDFYIKWRIVNVSNYFRATQGSEDSAGLRLAEVVKDGIKAVVAQRTLQQIVSAERTAFTGDMLARANGVVGEMGVELVDVRVQRIDLVDEVSDSVYQRMQESFIALAKRLRAEGAGSAEQIRAEADRQRTEILSNAARDAQRIRGEGDAAAATIYAKAYGRNPEFANFYRSLQAYRNSLGREGDIMVIQPDGDFYRYLRSSARH
jgi:modulator of FtsH protease HflC